MLASPAKTGRLSTGTQSVRKKMFITADGKILPCEKIAHKYSLGQITDDGVDIDPQQIATDTIATIQTYYRNARYVTDRIHVASVSFLLRIWKQTPFATALSTVNDSRTIYIPTSIF